MRHLLAVLAFILVAPTGLATHGYETVDGIAYGSKLLITWTASGSATSRGYEQVSETQTHDRSMSFDYRWQATAALTYTGSLFAGTATASGEGSGTASFVQTLTDDGTTYVTTTHCDLERTLGAHATWAVIDQEAQTLVVHLGDIGGYKEGEDCHSDEGPAANPYPYPSVAPLLAAAEANHARYQRLFGSAGLSRERLDILSGLTFEVPLVDDSWSGREVIDVNESTADDAASFSCAAPSPFPLDACVVRSRLEAYWLVDPCKVNEQSALVHLRQLESVRPPTGKVSESQARAFMVDVMQKVQALLTDLRALAFVGCDEPEGARQAITKAMEQVMEAWLQAARSGPISDDAKRDILALEKQNQMLGVEPSASVAPITQALQAGPGAPIHFGSHSPVSLHAWDEEGRHVGWDDEAGEPELGIANATYEGRPGDAQSITLPPGAYRFAAVPIGHGVFTMNISSNGHTQRIPLEAVPGRVPTLNALAHDGGLFLGAAALVADGLEQPFHVVSAVGVLQGSSSAAGASDDDGPDDAGKNGAPASGIAMVALALLALALARRR